MKIFKKKEKQPAFIITKRENPTKKQDQSKQEKPINQIRKTQQIRTKPTLLIQNWIKTKKKGKKMVLFMLIQYWGGLVYLFSFSVFVR